MRIHVYKIKMPLNLTKIRLTNVNQLGKIIFYFSLTFWKTLLDVVI